jgi:hypothetical protein
VAAGAAGVALEEPLAALGLRVEATVEQGRVVRRRRRQERREVGAQVGRLLGHRADADVAVHLVGVVEDVVHVARPAERVGALQPHERARDHAVDERSGVPHLGVGEAVGVAGVARPRRREGAALAGEVAHAARDLGRARIRRGGLSARRSARAQRGHDEALRAVDEQLVAGGEQRTRPSRRGHACGLGEGHRVERDHLVEALGGDPQLAVVLGEAGERDHRAGGARLARQIRLRAQAQVDGRERLHLLDEAVARVLGERARGVVRDPGHVERRAVGGDLEAADGRAHVEELVRDLERRGVDGEDVALLRERIARVRVASRLARAAARHVERRAVGRQGHRGEVGGERHARPDGALRHVHDRDRPGGRERDVRGLAVGPDDHVRWLVAHVQGVDDPVRRDVDEGEAVGAALGDERDVHVLGPGDRDRPGADRDERAARHHRERRAVDVRGPQLAVHEGERAGAEVVVVHERRVRAVDDGQRERRRRAARGREHVRAGEVRGEALVGDDHVRVVGRRARERPGAAFAHRQEERRADREAVQRLVPGGDRAASGGPGVGSLGAASASASAAGGEGERERQCAKLKVRRSTFHEPWDTTTRAPGSRPD